MQVDLSVVKGYRTYILMGANIVCVGLESLGAIPEGTWLKITAVLVSLGIVTNRAGSKNDAAAVTDALAAFNQASLTPSLDQGEEGAPRMPSQAPEATPTRLGILWPLWKGSWPPTKTPRESWSSWGRLSAASMRLLIRGRE